MAFVCQAFIVQISRAVKKKSIRDAVVDTASRLFYRQGYSNTGINQIIEEAGISKSGLYQHFSSKEDVLIAYLNKTGQETVLLLKGAADVETDPKAKMLAIFDYLEGLVQLTDFYGCHFLNMVYELPKGSERIREEIKKQKDEVRKVFAEIVAPVQQEGLADELYTLYEGALIGNKIHNNSWPIISARSVVNKII
jgi:AcrR family transcriptional regulator